MKQKLIPLREQGFHLRALPRAILFAVFLITPIAILITPEEPGFPLFIRALSSMLQMAGFGIIIAHRAPLWEREGAVMGVASKAGDAQAAAHFIALKWNASHPAGTTVTYEKSPLEGRIILKTCGAYVLGDEAVIELEHIGTAMLKKTETYSG